MNIEEIRKNAPKGATHYDIYGDWWKVNGIVAHFMYKNGSKWRGYAFDDIAKHISKGDVKPLF